MADIEYGESLGEVYPSDGFGLVNIMNWLGALISVALIAGLAWWGYQLMVRDVSGVPVVRALEGPMRIAPEDPGGQSADHQGLAVNNIAAEGTAADPADRLTLAPKPTALQEEDQTVKDLASVVDAETASAMADQEEIVELEAGATSSAEAGEPTPADTASLIEAALQMAEEGEVAPAADTSGIEVASADPASVTIDDLVPASVSGVSRSLIPTARPASMSVAATTAPEAGETGVLPVKVKDPASIPAGTRLAQLGAFESAEIAEQEWTKLAGQFGDFMEDKSQVVQKAQSGGKTFYRLRAYGFSDLSDARRFCSALLAGQANCIPVVTR